ncbi:uncharacterized protein LAESUDRAFT_723772 [Laetiporus sulphureus 93-53]|uniref:Uncharacterized protein n=1 Tax=Laetiporus sulphureus 93-53 TaxID=1314785 RepID=A0A165FDY1_9APHY|nr:uncharacterized protein LAESUDRAFT_723772 [Laetiporus sulphureus 93-53]KZT08824.1 hypothetical protein LAESUDRAFT_723772 [Laetiporus sulphureus 93-53]
MGAPHTAYGIHDEPGAVHHDRRLEKFHYTVDKKDGEEKEGALCYVAARWLTLRWVQI